MWYVDNKIADKIVLAFVSFDCHLTVYFPQEHLFLDYSGYYMGKVAVILDFARLCQNIREFRLAERVFFFIISF